MVKLCQTKTLNVAKIFILKKEEEDNVRMQVIEFVKWERGIKAKGEHKRAKDGHCLKPLRLNLLPPFVSIAFGPFDGTSNLH
jgi:hypothetical protein